MENKPNVINSGQCTTEKQSDNTSKNIIFLNKEICNDIVSKCIEEINHILNVYKLKESIIFNWDFLEKKENAQSIFDIPTSSPFSNASVYIYKLLKNQSIEDKINKFNFTLPIIVGVNNNHGVFLNFNFSSYSNNNSLIDSFLHKDKWKGHFTFYCPHNNDKPTLLSYKIENVQYSLTNVINKYEYNDCFNHGDPNSKKSQELYEKLIQNNSDDKYLLGNLQIVNPFIDQNLTKPLQYRVDKKKFEDQILSAYSKEDCPYPILKIIQILTSNN
jgi:hypothetical protein